MAAPAVNVENVTFQYDKRLETEILSSVSFTVKQGEWLAITGDNGSGKSTLAMLLTGLLKPRKGRIWIDGTEMNDENIWEIRQKIGLVFQNPDNQFIGSTVQDDVAFALENMNMPFHSMQVRVNEALKLTALTNFRLHDPSRLSGGQKQRVAIAGILAFKPSVLILDEAFVMLDPKSRRDLLATLQRLKKNEHLTIISITHDVNETAAADRVMVMKQGRVVNSGSPGCIFQTEPDLRPPFSEQLRRSLKERKKTVPEAYMTEDEVVQWLCKSNLKE